jgi:hypothetical protein
VVVLGPAGAVRTPVLGCAPEVVGFTPALGAAPPAVVVGRGNWGDVVVVAEGGGWLVGGGTSVEALQI